jgi:hypothetical protein
MTATVSDLIFALMIVAFGSIVLFSFIVIVQRFIITNFSPRETASLTLVAFFAGVIMESYLAGDYDMEIFASIVVVIFSAWLIYRAIRRGWLYRGVKREAQGGGP